MRDTYISSLRYIGSDYKIWTVPSSCSGEVVIIELETLFYRLSSPGGCGVPQQHSINCWGETSQRGKFCLDSVLKVWSPHFLPYFNLRCQDLMKSSTRAKLSYRIGHLLHYTKSTDLQRVVLLHISQWCLLTLKVKTRPIRTVDQAARRKTQSRMKASSSFLRWAVEGEVELCLAGYWCNVMVCSAGELRTGGLSSPPVHSSDWERPEQERVGGRR